MPCRDDLSLDWLVVIIVPQSEFMAQINANPHTTIFLCLAALAGAIALGLHTSRWIAALLLQMSRANAVTAQGELNQHLLETVPSVELEVRGRSLDLMTAQLRASFDQVRSALQRSKAKFGKIFHTSPDAIAIASFPASRLINVNLSFCQRSSYEREQVSNRTIANLNLRVAPTQAVRLQRLLCRHHAFHNVEVDLRTQFNQIRTALVAAELINLEGQTRLLLVAIDITERELQQAKDAADPASGAQSDLANMSHELRSPLNAILGFTQLLALSHQLAAEHREYVDIIQRSGEHLLQLMNDILDSSKIEAGRLTLDESRFDLHRLLQELLEMFQIKAQDKSIALQIDRAPALPQWIYADELKLRQVLINLIGNAIKLTQFSSITLRTAYRESSGELPPSDTLHFSVIDTSISIDRDRLGMIFEVFVQTASGRQAAEGTELGLSISQAFVQLMGGKVTMQSKVGQGSEFEFVIPVQVTTGLHCRLRRSAA